MLLLFYYVRQSDLILELRSCYVAWPRWLNTLSLSQSSRIGHRLGNPNWSSTRTALLKQFTATLSTSGKSIREASLAMPLLALASLAWL